jgi:hypothetical protein
MKINLKRGGKKLHQYQQKSCMSRSVYYIVHRNGAQPLFLVGLKKLEL